MHINGIFAQDSQFFEGDTPPAPQELGKDSFMQLLVTQLKNQDPLEPTGNQEFISQLANFSELEQMELVNENLLGMVILQQSNALMEQLTQSSALIGQEIEFVDDVTGHTDRGVVDSVRVSDGIAVLRVGDREVPLTQVTEVTGPPA